LDGGEADLTNARMIVKSEYSLCLVKGDALLYSQHVHVEFWHRAVTQV